MSAAVLGATNFNATATGTLALYGLNIKSVTYIVSRMLTQTYKPKQQCGRQDDIATDRKSVV